MKFAPDEARSFTLLLRRPAWYALIRSPHISLIITVRTYATALTETLCCEILVLLICKCIVLYFIVVMYIILVIYNVCTDYKKMHCSSTLYCLVIWVYFPLLSYMSVLPWFSYILQSKSSSERKKNLFIPETRFAWSLPCI